ncbi:hypothetical protein [Aquihabitans sp. McL0605]|uniref:hypothetical protein n=1 Tax=Aquihabitans sp. McL0605 TaxID=3415671 RepID=UPI003CF97B5D
MLKVRDWTGEPWFPPRPTEFEVGVPLRPKLGNWLLACLLTLPIRARDTAILRFRRRRANDSKDQL